MLFCCEFWTTKKKPERGEMKWITVAWLRRLTASDDTKEDPKHEIPDSHDDHD